MKVDISENHPDGKPTTTSMRTASLVYLVSEGNNSHTPLLHTNSPSYSRSTNHDRTETAAGINGMESEQQIVTSSSSPNHLND